MDKPKMDKPKFVYVSYISTTPEKLWNALMDAEMTKDYWARHKNVSDWQVGSEWSHQDYDTGAKDIVGEVLESDPPRRLVLTWGHGKESQQAEEPSRVTFLVEPYGKDAVRLTVTHEELEPDSGMLKGITAGWPAVLSSLKTMLETGEAMPMTKRRRWDGPPE